MAEKIKLTKEQVLEEKKIKQQEQKNRQQEQKIINEKLKDMPKVPKFKSFIIHFGFLLFNILITAAFFISSLVFKELINQNMNKFLMWIGIETILLLSTHIVNKATHYVMRKEVAKIKSRLRNFVFKSFSNKEGKKIILKKTGFFRSITIDTVDKYAENYVQGKYESAKNILGAVIALATIFYISWIIALSSLGIFILLIFTGVIGGTISQKYENKFNTVENEFNDSLSKKLDLHNIFYLNSSIAKLQDQLKRSCLKVENAAVKTLIKLLIAATPSFLVSVMCQLGLTIISAVLAVHGKIAVSALIAVIALTGTFSTRLTMGMESLPTTLSHKKFRNKFVVNSKEELVYVDIENIDNISIQDYNISFEGEKMHENNLNHELVVGQKYVIVGESGSGKSTLINSILGETEGYEGDILMNGSSSKELSPESLTRNFAFLQSSPHIFNATLMENITVFKRGNKEEIQKILEELKFTDLELDQKINLSSISEGQKQKINLARAIFKKPAWIISDEGFSNMDDVSRKNSIKLLGKRHAGGFISITHHLEKEEEVWYDQKIEL